MTNVTQILACFSEIVENIEAAGENTGNQDCCNICSRKAENVVKIMKQLKDSTR